MSDSSAQNQNAADPATELLTGLSAYYEDYYRNCLGLPDWRVRVKMRLNEAENYAGATISWLQTWYRRDFRDLTVLVVGAGTGAETIALCRMGARVVATEPFMKALHILRLRTVQDGEPSFFVVGAPGEMLPFPDASFDFVYCSSVLEHTQAPLRCLDEMLRVIRPDGAIFVEVPDYRFPYDSHYKLPWPPLVPRWLRAAYLWLRGRPTAFVDSLQFLNFAVIRRHLHNRGASFIRYFPPHPPHWHTGRRFWRIMRRFSLLTGITPNTTLLIRKNADPIS
jgi:ubiquinone/menaquinone biosynthesis C-methylase UbiE